MRRPNLITRVKQADPLYKAPLAELVGDSRLVIENHHGVLAYSTENICIKVKFGSIVIEGVNLCLRELSKDQLVITGTIHSLQLFKGGR